MKSLILSCMLAFSASAILGQGYEFTEVVTVPATPVKNQAATGTCWCFATTSFMESELLRMGKGTYDLSEMFIVRQKYMNQLQDNYLRRGDGNIGQGSLSHTFHECVPPGRVSSRKRCTRVSTTTPRSITTARWFATCTLSPMWQ